MIINFEDYTYELSEEEKKLIPLVLECFLHNTQPIVVDIIMEYLDDQHQVVISEVRTKKILSLIRRIPIRWNNRILIATSAGYFWENNANVIEKYIESLDARIEAIKALKEQAQSFLNH